MEKEKASSVWEHKPKKIVREEEGQLLTEITENIQEKEKVKNKLDLRKEDSQKDHFKREDDINFDERDEEDLNKTMIGLPKRILKVIVEKCDFTKMLINKELTVVENIIIPTLPPNDHSPKKVVKRKSQLISDIIQKRARREDSTSNMDEIEKEKELSDYVEHDKKYYCVHSAVIDCKLCGFKGKLIVQHYRASHPESEVLISRISPDIVEMLIEDAIRNREEYDEDHSELKIKCNFKCPFCLIIIKNTPKAYYNHICSHTGEYRFRCGYCSYCSYNSANIRSHLNKMHCKAHKNRYKTIYPDPKILKYVFGHICSECNFVQLTRRTVEEHAKVYHPGSPEIHRVNLGMLLYEETEVENHINEIHLIENHSNLNDSKLEEVKVKIEPEVLENDLHSTELPTFIHQPDLNIKEDSEAVEEVKEEALSSNVKFSVIISDQLLASNTEQIDTEKQNRKCLKTVTDTMILPSLNTVYNCNLRELVLPYKCEDDGFPSCPFKTLYFDEYLKHMEALHGINQLGLSLSEYELLKGAIMEGWLRKEVGPFQCRYCKKAMVTRQEMGKHQTVFHAKDPCLFYYRKFVPNDTVTNPEEVNLKDPSFINHLIHLPDQVHLCDLKLLDSLPFSTSTKLTDRASEALPTQPPTEIPKVVTDQKKIQLDEPDAFSLLAENEERLLDELDTLWLHEEPPKEVSAHNNTVCTTEAGSEAQKVQCEWKGCDQTYDSQTVLVKHIEKDHVKSQRGVTFTCFWISCPRKLKPYATRASLLLHMRLHSEEKPYKCPFQGCNKAFPYLEALKVHQRRHTGDRPYMCRFPNCFKSFASSSHRNSHQKKHETEPYTCQVTGCSKIYRNTSHLRRHLQTHTVKEQLEVKQKSVENKQKEGDFVLKESVNSFHVAIHQRTRYDTCEWEGCYQTFPSKAVLVEHIENNHIKTQKGEEFICCWINCPRKWKPFTVKENLLRHMGFHCHGEKLHNYSFEHLKGHQSLHTGQKPYLCQFPNCFKSFTNTSNRAIHERTHYDTTIYACQVTGCSKKYTGPRGLREHMKRHTVEEQLEVNWKPSKREQKKGDSVRKRPSNSLDMTKQEKTHHNTCEWEGCFQTFDSQAVLVDHIEEKHVKILKGEEFTCCWSNCPRESKPFGKKSTLLRHLRIHSGEKPNRCLFPGCTKTFIQPGNLKIHQRSHTREKPYLCRFPNCLKSFIYSIYRSNHERTHYDPKPFACQVTGCSNKYSTSSALWMHMKTHTIDERLEVKQKSIKNKQNKRHFVRKKPLNNSEMTKYQRTHHNTLQCKWGGCNQTYDSQTALTNHINKRHVQLQSGKESTCFWINCPRNSEPFTSKRNLLRHMSIHSGEKPYKCIGCNKAFSQLAHLKIHKRTHTGEKPYMCQFPNCIQSFSDISTMRKHQKGHFNTEPIVCQVIGCSKKYKHMRNLRRHLKNHAFEEQLKLKRKSVEKKQEEINDFITYDI